jgi:predicted transcriptional regulator
VKLGIWLWFEMITMVKLNKVDELVISTLKSVDKGLTLAEIAEGIGESEKKVFKTLRKLFENEMVSCQNRQYRLVNR